MTDKIEDFRRQELAVEHRETFPAEARTELAEPEIRESFPWGLPGSFSQLPVRRGALRSEFTTLSVRSDAEAVAAWIAEKGNRSTNTAQSYRREAERLMLWASEVKNKALSDLMLEDFLEFAAFLSNPAPAEKWISKRRHHRASPAWRPFMGPLSPASSRHTQIIIGSLFRYLHAKGWIRANPVPDPVVPESSTAEKGKAQYVGNESGGVINRSLSRDQWSAVEKVIDALPSETRKDQLFAGRTRWLLTLFHNCGPRVSEVATHGMGSIKPVRHRDRTIWVWHVMGKGRKLREIPLPTNVVAALCEFRSLLGLPPYPAPLEATPLAPGFGKMRSDGNVTVDSMRPLTRQSLYKIVTDTALAAAEVAENAEDKEALRRASTHWLRHTALKDLADNSDDLRFVQQVAGHADIRTTMIYTSAQTHELYDAMEAARDKSSDKYNPNN